MEPQVCYLKEGIARLLDQPGHPLTKRVLFGQPGYSLIIKLSDVRASLGGLTKIVVESGIAQEVASLLDDDHPIRIWRDQVIFKPAEVGGEANWHQDGYYWPTIDASSSITAWIALDDVTTDNGCLRMARGSHRWGLQHSFLNAVSPISALPDLFEGAPVDTVDCPLPRGAVQYHHPLCWHASNANKSSSSRSGLAVHFVCGSSARNLSLLPQQDPSQSNWIESTGSLDLDLVHPIVWPANNKGAGN
jgi:hypothetical protein